MSVLVDRDIAHLCDESFTSEKTSMIVPFSNNQLQPASYDVLLGKVFRSVDKTRLKPVYLDNPSSFEDLYIREEVDADGYFVLSSKGFVLACTEEWINVPDDIVGRINGKSSLARLGLVTESAGYLDPGFKGVVTMELYNQLPVPIILRVGLPIAQISFEYASGTPSRLYGDERLKSHYQNSSEAIESRYGT